MKALTIRQKEVLDFIRRYLKIHNYPPTIREIADSFNISTKGAYDHVKALEKKGTIACDAKRSRTIELLDDDSFERAAYVPLIGKVSAGDPIFAEENYEGQIVIPPSMLKKNKSCFALKVQGESMINAGIFDGDIAIFAEQTIANNGDIVLAMVHEEFTLKRFFNEGSRIRLQPENSSMSPIFTSDARILGKIVGVVRSYG